MNRGLLLTILFIKIVLGQDGYWITINPKIPIPSLYKQASIAVNGGSDILVFGGYGNPSFSSVLYRYNIPCNFWDVLDDGSSSPSPGWRTVVTSANWKNNMVIYGGFSYNRDLWVFNTTSFSWTEYHNGTSGVYPQASEQASLVIIGDILYLYGGWTTSTNSAALWTFNLGIFDFPSQFSSAAGPGENWRLLWGTNNGTTPIARNGAVFVYYNSLLYMYGGGTFANRVANDSLVWTFDPQNPSGGWTIAFNTQMSLYHNYGYALYGSKIYMQGGQQGSNLQSSGNFMYIDLQTNISGNIYPSNSSSRAFGTMTSHPEGIYVFGGAFVTSSGSENALTRNILMLYPLAPITTPTTSAVTTSMICTFTTGFVTTGAITTSPGLTSGRITSSPLTTAPLITSGRISTGSITSASLTSGSTTSGAPVSSTTASVTSGAPVSSTTASVTSGAPVSSTSSSISSGAQSVTSGVTDTQEGITTGEADITTGFDSSENLSESSAEITIASFVLCVFVAFI